MEVDVGSGSESDDTGLHHCLMLAYRGTRRRELEDLDSRPVGDTEDMTDIGEGPRP